MLDAGSSPRVRGTDSAHWARLRSDRFIPACAGNREPSASIAAKRPVHPRVCGEQSSGCPDETICAGSSPRVRGTVRIPQRGIVLSAVHPRVCGEQKVVTIIMPMVFGSSPRVRGTGILSSRPSIVRRFIPACAGNSSGLERSSVIKPVHPRVCGEQFRKSVGTPHSVGSSPRVRGTAKSKGGSAYPKRFIPACAGNS